MLWTQPVLTLTLCTRPWHSAELCTSAVGSTMDSWNTCTRHSPSISGHGGLILPHVDLVRTLCEQFHRGVERNIRMRTLANLGSNLRMLFSSSYSRSARLGDLYARELYSQVKDRTSPG